MCYVPQKLLRAARAALAVKHPRTVLRDAVLARLGAGYQLFVAGRPSTTLGGPTATRQWLEGYVAAARGVLRDHNPYRHCRPRCGSHPSARSVKQVRWEEGHDYYTGYYVPPQTE